MPRKQVAIIGGGIAGITAALELSRYNLDIHLIEKDYFLGGQAINYNCKAKEQCLQCYACMAERKLKELNRANNVHFHLASRVFNLEKQNNLHLELIKSPLFETKAEQEVLQAVYNKRGTDNLVLRGPSKNNLPLYALDLNRIKETGISGSSDLAMLRGNLDLERSYHKQTIQVDSIILATGFKPFNPEQIGTYHYSQLENVVSALDMEKIRKSKGDYLRPSDNSLPRKIAFIQCVGSRSQAKGTPRCSRVCCAYALKMAEAILAENPDAEITFFYMDIQDTGRTPVLNPQNRSCKFNFIRMMPVDILPGTDSSLKIRYMSPQEEKMDSQEFDLAILSQGIAPNPENPFIAESFDLPLDRYGFLDENAINYSRPTKSDGIFVAGTAASPGNIAESMEHAGETVKRVINYLAKQEKTAYGHDRRIILEQDTGNRRGMDRYYHGK